MKQLIGADKSANRKYSNFNYLITINPIKFKPNQKISSKWTCKHFYLTDNFFKLADTFNVLDIVEQFSTL